MAKPEPSALLRLGAQGGRGGDGGIDGAVCRVTSSDIESEPTKPSALLRLGAQGGHGGDGGIDGVVRGVTGRDIENGPTDNHHDHREEEEQDDDSNKLMDKLSKFILALVASVSMPAGARSTAMRFNRAAAIFLLASFATSLASVVCTHLRRLRRRWRRALACASCASFVLATGMFLASLDLLLFAAAVAVAAIVVVTVTAVATGSAAADGDDDGDGGGQSAGRGHLMVRVFDNCALFVTGGLAGLFFGSNYSNYLMRSSGLAGVVRVLWIALFVDMAIGIFVMAGIAARIQAITARARRFYHVTVALFGLCVVLFIIVMGFGQQRTTMAAATPPTQIR